MANRVKKQTHEITIIDGGESFESNAKFSIWGNTDLIVTVQELFRDGAVKIDIRILNPKTS
jgi:hypothetical protein